MKILIDNGHGKQTPGKRSPDGRFLEFKFNREIAAGIVADLRDKGYDAELLVEEDDDVPLAQRCKRANAYSQALGKENVILVSIHANAFGNGSEWTKPRGWSVYTSKGQTKADLLADDLAMAAIKYFGKQAIRGDFAAGDIDYEEGFYILKHTISPAVLTENFFMTNEQDLQLLESQSGKQSIIDLHVEGIIEYLSR